MFYKGVGAGSTQSGGESLRIAARIYRMIHYERCTDLCWLRRMANGDSLADLRNVWICHDGGSLQYRGRKKKTIETWFIEIGFLYQKLFGSSPNGGVCTLQKQEMWKWTKPGPQNTTNEQCKLLVRSADESSHTLLLQLVAGRSGHSGLVVSGEVVGFPTVSLWLLASYSNMIQSPLPKDMYARLIGSGMNVKWIYVRGVGIKHPYVSDSRDNQGGWMDGWMDDDMTKISCPNIACFIYQHNIHHAI